MSGAESSGPCRRRGCTGRYRDDGGDRLFCDTCGAAPALSRRGVLGPVATEVTRPGLPPSPRPGPGHSVPAAYRRAPLGRSRSAAGSSRSRLGAGLVTVPPVPRPDPLAAVMERPEVPERKRFCGNSGCAAPVGRRREGRPGSAEGRCERCGHPYSFLPKLAPGDLVHGQYEIAGCLAHGGMGWVYLAVDRAVADRWVVLKGLLDTGDEDAMLAAISERRFLAEIEHPTIVRIYNFVEHPDPRTGSLDGYIVMEYVGGRSLREIANARHAPGGHRDPLPVDQACAYGLEILDALGHLHSRHLLYCDFKADNAIQQGDRLKLIDMGAVRRMDDEVSAVYGTAGYQAPEVPEDGPSVASDLYTVARTLALLTFDFQGFTTVYADSLPDPETVEVFRAHESFYRLLVRATDPEPARRFSSAEEMAEQLTGVLREVVALRTGIAQPALSRLFGPERTVVDTGVLPRAGRDVSVLGARAGSRRAAARPRPASALVPPAAPRTVRLDARRSAVALPVPLPDPDDPNAAFLAGLTGAAPGTVLAALKAAPADSLELRLRRLRALLEAPEQRVHRALDALEELEEHHREDWRVVWHQGLVSLARGFAEAAAASFDAVHDALPGEVAPKLALGVCAEVEGRLEEAARYYAIVWATDPGQVGAGFGLARVRLAAGDREGAVAALESVPRTSAHCAAARIAAVRARLRQRPATDPLLPVLRAAARQVEELRADGLEPAPGEQLSCEVLGAALDWVLAGRAGQTHPPPPGGPAREHLLGHRLDEEGIRLGLERSFRRLARLTPSKKERIDLVEAANRFRPRTWV
ncbi:hypothetical protein GCM10009716_11150 [Streptomyces sodiiphilus]|uniref:non-specific serine/threonine protein kinase n=1 Tax=Streptomyces sodiiphilus TaxID=226217 RepID=A0ABP5A993_9ACTN